MCVARGRGLSLRLWSCPWRVCACACECGLVPLCPCARVLAVHEACASCGVFAHRGRVPFATDPSAQASSHNVRSQCYSRHYEPRVEGLSGQGASAGPTAASSCTRWGWRHASARARGHFSTVADAFSSVAVLRVGGHVGLCAASQADWMQEALDYCREYTEGELEKFYDNGWTLEALKS